MAQREKPFGTTAGQLQDVSQLSIPCAAEPVRPGFVPLRDRCFPEVIREHLKGTIMRMKRHVIALASVLLIGVVVGQAWVRADHPSSTLEQTRLAVVWTSGDSEVAHKVCLMYTHAAKNATWFEEVKLIVWGPSSRILAADKELQAKVKAMMENGVDVKACIVCANMYGVTDDLREMGIEVKPMGKPLSGLLKTNWKVLTF